MANKSRTWALVLILIMAISNLSLMMVKPAFAQVIPKPSAPEFTLKVVASSIEVTIKNQPIIAFENGSSPNLYYGFRFKDHENIQDWNYAPIYYVGISSYGTYYNASTSNFTVVSFPFGSYPLTNILGSGRVDLQVMALTGNEVPTNYENGSVYGFEGVTSDWSEVQTITIAASSTSPTPTVPEFSWLVILPLFFSIICIAVAITLKKSRNFSMSRLF